LGASAHPEAAASRQEVNTITLGYADAMAPTAVFGALGGTS
jgi:hypothetical protein